MKTNKDMLPEKWCVKLSQDLIVDYFNKLHNSNFEKNRIIHAYPIGVKDENGKIVLTTKNKKLYGYKLLKFRDFERFVLNV